MTGNAHMVLKYILAKVEVPKTILDRFSKVFGQPFKLWEFVYFVPFCWSQLATEQSVPLYGETEVPTVYPLWDRKSEVY